MTKRTEIETRLIAAGFYRLIDYGSAYHGFRHDPSGISVDVGPRGSVTCWRVWEVPSKHHDGITLTSRCMSLTGALIMAQVLPGEPSGPVCERCNDSGTIAISTAHLTYRGPGPVPEDARGVCEVVCDCRAING